MAGRSYNYNNDNFFNCLMQKILLILLIVFLSMKAEATNYYFSSLGSDGNSGAIGSPWLTLTKLNAVWLAGTFAPGDSILFRRGDTFFGMIAVSESGTLGNPIVISGYGAGAMPVITGFVTLSGWTSIGAGRYEVTNSSLGDTVNVVTINGVSYAMGRYPNDNATNKGYLNFELHTGSTSITDNQLTGVPDWTNADVVVRTNRYILDRRTITDHAIATLNFFPGTFYVPSNGFGYFIENSINTLDKFGEWYYNPGTQKVTMYFGAANPTSYTIKATAKDTLYHQFAFENIEVVGLSFQGANIRGMNFRTVQTGVSKVLNCEVKFCGENAIFCSGTSKKIVFDNNVIEDADWHGIFISGGDHYTITNNSFKRIAILPGHAGPVNTNTAIRANADDCLIQYNVIDSVGFIGIRFAGDNNTVRNNFVQHFTMMVDDGSGIYTGNGSPIGGNKIVSNIVINGAGALEGTTSNAGATHGIYLDDNTNDVIVDSNSVANTNLSSIYLHNAYGCFIRYNNTYNGGVQELLLVHNSPNANFRNTTINNNVFFSKTAIQYTLQAKTDSSDLNFSLWGTFNNNYHARPLAQTIIIRAVRPNFQQNMNIPDWYSFTGLDQNSFVSPKTYGAINPDDSIRFEYNATKVNKTILLPGTYTDVQGNIYTNSDVLTPFTSKTYMSTAYVTDPPASDPPTITITGPTDGSTYVALATIPLTADAADDTGLSDVKWYANGTLIATLNSDPYSFVWDNVPAGSYSITAVATDIEGQSTTSAGISVTVTSPPTGGGATIYLRINKILVVQ